MSKDALLQQIQSVREQISEADGKLKDLEEKLEVLQAFKDKCNSKAEAFIESVERRRNKLAGINGLINYMKSALNYRQRMNDLLTGMEYIKTQNSVDTLLEKVNGQKEQLSQQIDDTETTIEALKRKLQNLQYQYDTYPEEVAEDG